MTINQNQERSSHSVAKVDRRTRSGPTLADGLHRDGRFDKEHTPNRPLVTVITTVLNGAAYIEQTIRSVLAQTYDNIEYVIIDGGSTDGTLDIIKKYDKKLAYWQSEPDAGFYDGLNKGLSRASGDVIGVLNASDWYEPGAVEKSVRTILTRGADYSYGKVRVWHPGRKIYTVTTPVSADYLTSKLLQEMAFPHISMFVRKQVFASIGYFNTSFRIAGDQEFVLRMHRAGYRGANTNEMIGTIRAGGVSDSVAACREYMRIARMYGRSQAHATAVFALQTLKFYTVRLLPWFTVKWLLGLARSRHLS